MTPLPDSVAGASAVLIAGPTASGKSVLALDVAESAIRRGRAALIVNTDALQVYDGLRLLSARPSKGDELRVPHRLYGHVPPGIRYSVGAWLRDAQPVLRQAEEVGSLVIMVGGTGLYFKAATEGFVAVPEIPEAVRRKWMERLRSEGAAALHARLAIVDPQAAASIRAGDASRIVRALEVNEATGTPLTSWQADAASPPLVPLIGTVRFVLEPDRQDLYRRINARMDQMVVEGALEEVEALLQRGIDPQMPVMKAIGVAEFASVLNGRSAMADALSIAKRRTRNYAKRQMTWFRNQMRDWPRLPR